MKIVVFSDSHGDVQTMVRIVKKIRPDLVLHLGDYVADAVRLEKEIRVPETIIVKGNMDFGSAVATEKTIDINGKRMFITHGHEYGVKNGTKRVFKKGRGEGADLILFGHTHTPYMKVKKGITLLNPGKIGISARGFHEPTYGVCRVGESISCEIRPASED